MKNITFRKSLTAAAVAASLGFPALAIAQDAQSDVNMEEEVERIQVTGSRIKRTDLEGDLPVTVIDRESLELSGDISVADVIRGTTFNSAGSFRPQSGSSAQGVSSVDMRGLGANRTLVLIDGRRLPKSPATGSTQDLNSIPLAAVERIEILSDGASAVYGSDAIGGVINVVLRDDFNGVELKLGSADVSLPSDGGDREEGSIVFGSSSDKIQVLGGVSWNNRDIIFENAYPWNEPGFSVYGNNFTDILTPAQNDVVADFAENNPDDEDTTIRDLIPGYMPGFNAIPGACDIPNYRLGSNGQTINGEGAQACGYNFNATNANEASTGNKSIFLRGDYQINDDWNIYFSGSNAQTKSFGRYAPSLNDTNRTISADSPNNPTNPDGNVYDPRTADADGNPQPRQVNYWHRFAALGNRDNNVEMKVNDLLFGAQGYVGMFDIDFGVRRNTTRTTEIGENYLLSSQARNYVNDGSYDLRDPLGTRFEGNPELAEEYLETYGRTYQDTLRGINVTTSRRGKFDQEEAYVSAGFDVYEINGGMIQMVVGADYRKEIYADKYDSLSESGSVGGSSGSSAAGERYVRAGYFETLFPITMDFEVTLAGRYDDYSDYGSDFSPKLSARWSVNEDLVLRGSWGQGFRAPSLDILTAQPSLSADSISDEDTCVAFGQEPNCQVQVQSTVISNPDLQSEQSEQMAFGLAYQATDYLDFSVDYYDIEIEERISTLGAQTLINRAAQGDPIPAAFSVTRDPATNGITGVVRGSVNEGTLTTNGVDFNIRSNFDFGSAGSLVQNLQASWVNEYRFDDGRNFVGDQDLPEYRANLSNVYRINNFDFAWNINHIASVDGPSGENDLVASWTTHDVQAGYTTDFGTKFVIGARNVFEKEPQLIGYGGRNYNFNLYDAYGRIAYFRVTQTF
ncbi:TonB-dependent receptor [Idiomarina sp. WRN-38]|uniref:TonB-dependent receptor plug domain-containing protein n=1 Tax=Idiomarina sp. OXR-189 TaxID=3100175 RepID=UPI0007339081|nr:TonB-dependent receptor [Idiomarina sp. OXR-189]KTG24226.1 TonB-dependent receptor [Idiomarina sp. H105]OAE91617.1 TonB-dependent receptor [Idiomarina sp. WRN-38]WPZ02039.1 TonB-dependent receptor [Idiomarina sp. OXR-189]